MRKTGIPMMNEKVNDGLRDCSLGWNPDDEGWTKDGRRIDEGLKTLLLLIYLSPVHARVSLYYPCT